MHLIQSIVADSQINHNRIQKNVYCSTLMLLQGYYLLIASAISSYQLDYLFLFSFF